MNELENGICSACGGKLEVDSSAECVVCPFCGTTHSVAKILGESDAVRIEKMRMNAQKEQEERKMEQDASEQKKQEKKSELESFKKSKFSKVLIVFTVIAVLDVFVAFSGSMILAGLVAVLQVAAFLIAWLMGMQVIPERKHNFRLIPAIVGFVLFVPFLCFFDTGKEEVPDVPPVSEESQVDSESALTTARPDEKAELTTGKQQTTTSAGLRPEFKKAMDSYESFMDEYVAFMQKYNHSDDTVSMLADYTKYMTKYAQTMKDFEAWEDNDLNTAETAYYLQVQGRVSQKLLTVAE